MELIVLSTHSMKVVMTEKDVNTLNFKVNPDKSLVKIFDMAKKIGFDVDNSDLNGDAFLSHAGDCEPVTQSLVRNDKHGMLQKNPHCGCSGDKFYLCRPFLRRISSTSST